MHYSPGSFFWIPVLFACFISSSVLAEISVDYKLNLSPASDTSLASELENPLKSPQKIETEALLISYIR